MTRKRWLQRALAAVAVVTRSTSTRQPDRWPVGLSSGHAATSVAGPATGWLAVGAVAGVAARAAVRPGAPGVERGTGRGIGQGGPAVDRGGPL